MSFAACGSPNPLGPEEPFVPRNTLRPTTKVLGSSAMNSENLERVRPWEASSEVMMSFPDRAKE